MSFRIVNEKLQFHNILCKDNLHWEDVDEKLFRDFFYENCIEDISVVELRDDLSMKKFQSIRIIVGRKELFHRILYRDINFFHDCLLNYFKTHTWKIYSEKNLWIPLPKNISCKLPGASEWKPGVNTLCDHNQIKKIELLKIWEKDRSGLKKKYYCVSISFDNLKLFRSFNIIQGAFDCFESIVNYPLSFFTEECTNLHPEFYKMKVIESFVTGE